MDSRFSPKSFPPNFSPSYHETSAKDSNFLPAYSPQNNQKTLGFAQEKNKNFFSNSPKNQNSEFQGLKKGIFHSDEKLENIYRARINAATKTKEQVIKSKSPVPWSGSPNGQVFEEEYIQMSKQLNNKKVFKGMGYERSQIFN